MAPTQAHTPTAIRADHGRTNRTMEPLIETIKVYQEWGVTDHLKQYGEKLISGMNGIARELDIGSAFKVVGTPYSPNYLTFDRAGQNSLELRTLFSQEMIRSGVLMPWIALSYRHGDSELDQTLSATREALKVVRQAVEAGTTDGLLRGRAIKPVFRKFN